MMEAYIWEEQHSKKTNKFLTVIIYDITDNKRRLSVVKCLEKYGYRVQKSAFEAFLDQKLFEQLKMQIPKIIAKEDAVKIYRLKGVSETYVWGEQRDITEDEWIFI